MKGGGGGEGSDGEGTLVSSVLRKVVPASNGLVVEGEFAVVGSGSWDFRDQLSMWTSLCVIMYTIVSLADFIPA